MKKVFSLLLVSVFMAAFTGTNVAFAQTSSSPTTTTPTSQPATTLNDRLTERRNRIKPSLTAAQKTKIAAACVPAQAKAKAVLKKLDEGQQPYQTKYDAYSKNLKELQTKLKSEGKDTTDLEANIKTLDQKYAAYKASLQKLTTSMNDLTTVDCKTEPNGFKATLEDARTQIKATFDARKDLNVFAKDSIVKSLQNLKGAN